MIPIFLHICILIASDGPGLDFSGFGRARAFMYRALGGPGFFVSGFGLFQGIKCNYLLGFSS